MSENITAATIQPQFVSLPIPEILLSKTVNTRVLDNDIVVEYKESIESYGASWQDHWNELPRITESKHLWSGFHTVKAAYLVFGERGKIRCVVEGQNYRDAYFLATRTNAQHGRRRTNAEKQTAVDRWLNDEEMNQWTDGYIAKLCYVSAQFVSNRRALATIASQPTKRKFINAKGEVEWMHTTRIGKTQTPPPKADQFPPPLTAKSKQNEFDMMIRHRESAHEIWKGYCQKNKIDFDWEDFCLFAEKHNGGPGALAALHPIESLFEEIQARSQTWKSIIRAIAQDVDWIVEYRNQNQAPSPAPNPPAPPDREGLRKNLEAMVGSDTAPNPSILTKLYHVPEAEIHAEIEAVFGEEEEKKPPAPEFSPPPSTNRGIVFQAHNEARAAYNEMMGGEPASKVADKYWESFLAEAKGNAPRGKGLPRGDNTGTGDPYKESKAKHIVGAWQWIEEQCRPPVQQNKPTEAEQKIIDMNLLERQPAVCHPPRPDWLRAWTYDVACRMSDFNIVMHGLNYEGEIGRLEFQPATLLSPENLERIVAATREAIDFELQEILAERQENQEAPQSKPE